MYQNIQNLFKSTNQIIHVVNSYKNHVTAGKRSSRSLICRSEIIPNWRRHVTGFPQKKIATGGYIYQKTGASECKTFGSHSLSECRIPLLFSE